MGMRQGASSHGPVVATHAALLSVLLLGALRVPRAGAVTATADTEDAELAVCRQ